MQAIDLASAHQRYAKTIEVSKRIRWDIDRDVIRGRQFDPSHKFLPDDLVLAPRMRFLHGTEALLVNQVQGRTYANMFGLVERYIGAKMLEVSRDHWFGDQVALEAIVRFTDEELKHQALFRRIEAMMAAQMPGGYAFLPQPNEVADFVLGKSTWAVLGLTCHIEIFTQVHYRTSVEPDAAMSPLFKDILFYHWREESQHAIIDELEWRREDAKLTPAERDAAVDDLIALVGAVDGILQAQAMADARYFCAIAGTLFSDAQQAQIHDTMLKAYRWQYIVSGVMAPRFQKVLFPMLDDAQGERIKSALAPLAYAMPRHPEMALPMAA
jgi:hypothetical protein